MFSRAVTNPIQEIVVNIVNKTQCKLATSIAAASFFTLGGTVVAGNVSGLDPSAAQASPEHSTKTWSVTYPVGYSDLDVSKLKGAKTLYLRIRHAAETLCESTATWGKKDGEACVRKAVDDAVVRVNVPLLTQYYELRSKGDRAGLVQLAKAN
jgi:UrcA family protein